MPTTITRAIAAAMTVAAACGEAAPHPAPAPAAPGPNGALAAPAAAATPAAGAGAAAAEPATAPRRRGENVRVAISHSRPTHGLGLYAATWLHVDSSTQEHLTITADGTFDWQIDHVGGSGCRIAGAVALVESTPPAFSWTMTTNTCNSAYQGRTTADWIVAHDDGHLVLVDAEFASEPVPYDLRNGEEGPPGPLAATPPAGTDPATYRP